MSRPFAPPEMRAAVAPDDSAMFACSQALPSRKPEINFCRTWRS